VGCGYTEGTQTCHVSDRKNAGTFILKIRRDVTLLREERDMSVLRVSKAVRLLVQMGILLY